jgi:peroxiredoxin Q/BCP
MTAMSQDTMIGLQAPAFCLFDQERRKVCLGEFLNRWVVLYFYPRDNTPGCTLEAKGFSSEFDAFYRIGAIIIGISADSVESHLKFASRYDLRLHLLSDTGHEVLKLYGVWQPKVMFGKEIPGIIRSTFLIGPDGRVREVWRKVKVPGHVDAVRARLEELSRTSQ